MIGLAAAYVFGCALWHLAPRFLDGLIGRQPTARDLDGRLVLAPIWPALVAWVAVLFVVAVLWWSASTVSSAAYAWGARIRLRRLAGPPAARTPYRD